MARQRKMKTAMRNRGFGGQRRMPAGGNNSSQTKGTVRGRGHHTGECRERFSITLIKTTHRQKLISNYFSLYSCIKVVWSVVCRWYW